MGETTAEAVSRLRDQLGRGVRIVILGSTTFNCPDSEEITKSIAGLLCAKCSSQAIFITGGMPGVQKVFVESCTDQAQLCNLVAQGMVSGYSKGRDIYAGLDNAQKRAVLGEIGDIYLCIEGGPGVAEEARHAHERKVCVIPVMRTGGASSGEFEFPKAALQKSPFATVEQWDLLKNKSASAAQSAAAVAGMVANAIFSISQQTSQLGADPCMVFAPPGAGAALLQNLGQVRFFDTSSREWKSMDDSSRRWLKAYITNDYNPSPAKSWSPQRGVRIGLDKTGYYVNCKHVRSYFGLPEFFLGDEEREKAVHPKQEEEPQKQPQEDFKRVLLMSIFRGADRNNNKSLDVPELSLMLRRIAPGLKREQVEQIMKEYDTNRNGSMEFEEFVNWLSNDAPGSLGVALGRSVGTEKDAVRAALRIVDTDGSGTLSKQELRKILSATCPDVGDGLDSLLNSLDTDGNGEIDYHEFVNVVFGA